MEKNDPEIEDRVFNRIRAKIPFGSYVIRDHSSVLATVRERFVNPNIQSTEVSLVEGEIVVEFITQRSPLRASRMVHRIVPKMCGDLGMTPPANFPVQFGGSALRLDYLEEDDE